MGLGVLEIKKEKGNSEEDRSKLKSPETMPSVFSKIEIIRSCAESEQVRGQYGDLIKKKDSDAYLLSKVVKDLRQYFIYN